MAEADAHATQHEQVLGIAAQLRDAGFDDVEEIGRGGFGLVFRANNRCWIARLPSRYSVPTSRPTISTAFCASSARWAGSPGTRTSSTFCRSVPPPTVGRSSCSLPRQWVTRGLIGRTGPLEWSDTLRFGVKLAGALEAAHRADILHRDVKPANILLTDYGEPQLTDFGIARIVGGFQTGTGLITGSPAYTAPEVLAGATPTLASDVYSLGATLFSTITGHAAFERHSGEQVIAQFVRITSQPIPDLRERGLPADVAAIVERAMARDPADRPTSAAAFGEELRELQRLSGVSVDEMARPVELGAQQLARGSVIGSAAHHRDPGDSGDEIPSPDFQYDVGGPRAVDGHSSSEWTSTADPDSRALGVRQKHAGGTVA